MAYYVYMLRCSDGSYYVGHTYVGHTNDLEQRLAAHERGAIEGYTLSRRPVELVFSDQFSTRQEAFHRERQIKGWYRAKKEALIKGDWDGLVELSNRRSGQAILRQAQDEGGGLRMKVLVDEDDSKIKMRKTLARGHRDLRRYCFYCRLNPILKLAKR